MTAGERVGFIVESPARAVGCRCAVLVRERDRGARCCAVHIRIIAYLGRGVGGDIRRSLGSWFRLPGDACGPGGDGREAVLSGQLLVPSPRSNFHRLVDQTGQHRVGSGLGGNCQEALEMESA